MDSPLPIWKTVELGTDPNIFADHRPFLTTGWREDYANYVISGLEGTLSRRKKRVDLVLAAASELTGKSGDSNMAEVFAGARRRGLRKCLPEVPFQLCRQYNDELLDPEFWVAIIRKFGVFSCIYLGMKPLYVSGYGSLIFLVSYNHEKGPCLSVCNLNLTAYPLSEMPVIEKQPFIFVRGN